MLGTAARVAARSGAAAAVPSAGPAARTRAARAVLQAAQRGPRAVLRAAQRGPRAGRLARSAATRVARGQAAKAAPEADSQARLAGRAVPLAGGGTAGTTGLGGNAGGAGGRPAVHTANLILNGDAEAALGSIDGQPVATPSWTMHAVSATAMQYGQSGYPEITDPGPTPRGMNLFIGGANDATSTLSQTIDVSTFATGI